MKRRSLVVLSVILLFVLVLAACGSSDGNNDASGNVNENVNAANENENEAANDAENEDNDGSLETVYPLTVVDTTGEEITFEAAPERIVSTSPSETEILFALGLGDHIVGVSDFDNYPEEVNTKERVGGIVTPNVEMLLALEPDLIVTGISIGEEAVNKIREYELTLFRTDPESIEDVLDNILLMGKITNRQAEAQQLVENMQEDIDYVASKVGGLSDEEKKRVYLEFAPGWTVGQGEFMHELLEMAGGINIAADTTGWSQINEEMIIEADPEVILYGAAIVVEDTPLNEVIAQRSGWDAINAVANSQIHPMDDDILTRPGPRITEGLKMMAEAIYPELFGE